MKMILYYFMEKQLSLMNHLGGNGIAWFMLSGYSGPHTWLSTQDCVVVFT
jgi:hypothetical protein